jgi:hypothetical protein
MSKCLIVKTQDSIKKATVFFCEDGEIYFETKGSYAEARDVLDSLGGVAIKFLPGMADRIKLIKKLLEMNYKDAANFYFKDQKSKGRKCKIFEGEFNGK